MTKRANKPRRNDLVVSGLCVRGPQGPGLLLTTDHQTGKPHLWLYDDFSNAVSISVDTNGRSSLIVSKDILGGSHGAGISVDVFGGGMGASSRHSQLTDVEFIHVHLEEAGITVRSSVGKLDESGCIQAVSQHCELTETPPDENVGAA